MESFRKLGLSEGLIKEVENAKFKEPSEIQERTIPIAMQGKDIIGGSATGSGKTLAFGASIIDKCKKGEKIQALILTPTRELAEQVGNVIRKFSRFKNLGISIVYGGVGLGPQIDSLQRSEIVVGTPGRILDHLQRRTIDISKIKTLVLDEADRMLDMGFIEDVERIISKCPKQRQTMLFSATISLDIENIASKHMHNPEYVAVDSYVDPSLLKQIYYDVSQDLKFSFLLHLLKHEHAGLVMVFCNTQRNTDFIASNLIKFGVDATAIHGGLSQAKRNNIMERFHAGKTEVLVCTDVAARGLDIKGVSHIYNYDIPLSSKEYIHRIGRTARAGKDGIAISIVSQRDYDNFRNVLRNPDLKIGQEKLPEVERVNIKFVSDRSYNRDGQSGGMFRDRRNFGNRQSFGRNRPGRSVEGRRFDGNRTHQGNREFRSDRRTGSNRHSGESRRFGSRGRGRSFGRRF
ncbi:MAG: DEAD/DEAH box helicase [Nanoarchaeota archaeon]